MLRAFGAILFCATLSSTAVAAMEKPFRVSIVGDNYTGDGWQTGIRIDLKDGWKTYWRMPGSAGIPPQFTWKTSGPAEIEVFYPVPGRFEDASGETVGYKDQVIFPVQVRAPGATSVKLELDLFFAVCEDICIPAAAQATAELGPAMRDPDGSRDVGSWMERVPSQGEPVTAAVVETSGEKPVLRLSLAQAVNDIFVETDTGAYFHQPAFSPDGTEAVVVIDNVKDVSNLKGLRLRLTAVTGDKGLEQTVTLP